MDANFSISSSETQQDAGSQCSSVGNFFENLDYTEINKILHPNLSVPVVGANFPSSETECDIEDFFENLDYREIDKMLETKNKSIREMYRPTFLYVSDLVQHTWCGHKMLYSIQDPGFEAAVQEVVSQTNPEVKPVINIGSKIHEKREAEAHTTKRVKVTTAEDSFGLRILNQYLSIGIMLRQGFDREFTIFGFPFDFDIPILGIIDEIRLDKDEWKLVLRETKTRNSKRPPVGSQETGHRLQIMLYYKLFLDYFSANSGWEKILSLRKLDGLKPFSGHFQKEINAAGIEADNLNALHQKVLDYASSVLPKEYILEIEYVCQGDGETFCVKQVEYDETWLKSKMESYIDQWNGKIPLNGVQDGEGWKCQTCIFADNCEWRTGKFQEEMRQRPNSIS